MFHLYLFSKILQWKGYYCITYAYDTSVLTPDGKATVRNIHTVANDIVHKIQGLQKENIKEFIIIGNSRGTIITLVAANKANALKKIILNLSGAYASEIVWSWDLIVPGFKQELLNKGYTLDKLKEDWLSIDPIYNLDNIKGRQIIFFYSEKDKVIPVSQSKLLISELRKKKNTLFLYKRSGQHSINAISNLFSIILFKL